MQLLRETTWRFKATGLAYILVFLGVLTPVQTGFAETLNDSSAPVELIEPYDEQVADSIAVLLGWAVHLSAYPKPEKPPRVQFKPHSFFTANACSGRECKAVGWYNDKGIVYIDERLRNAESMFARSLFVHEFVHYLQDLSGNFDSNSCPDIVMREREAYAVQRDYVVTAHGQPSSFSMLQFNCNQSAVAGHEH